MHESMQNSLIYARLKVLKKIYQLLILFLRDEALSLMKMQIEIRKCLMDITLRVDKAIKEESKLISKE